MDPPLLSRLGTVVDVAGMTPDQAAEVLAAHRPDGIVSFVDDHIEDAAALAERLGLRYHTPEVACSVVDKRIQRTALAGAGVAGPEFRVIPPGASEGLVADLGSELGYPVVLKPARGSGSRGILLMRRPTTCWPTRRSSTAPSWASSRSCSPMTRPGTLRSPVTCPMESVVSGGTVSHTAVTGRFPLASDFLGPGTSFRRRWGTTSSTP